MLPVPAKMTQHPSFSSLSSHSSRYGLDDNSSHSVRSYTKPYSKPTVTYYSVGQVLAICAASASVAAMLTALVATFCLSDVNVLTGMPVPKNHHMFWQKSLNAAVSPINPRSSLRNDKGPILETNTLTAAVVTDVTDVSDTHHSSIKSTSTDASVAVTTDVELNKDGLPLFQRGIKATNVDYKTDQPQVAWLMSFPNSGTSFTLHMTREASNCTTATNYALEGEIRDEPSVPAIQGSDGVEGPWLELIPNRTTEIPAIILTKTHCKGFCNGATCGPDSTIHNIRSFMMGCLSGSKAIKTENGIEKVPTRYAANLVKKAIHIFRHPLDNIVARFHLEYQVQVDINGNSGYAKQFPRNAVGFHRWCKLDDQNRLLLKSRFMDATLRKKMIAMPCMNDFYRYAQWHNLAFATSREMGVPTMLLRYHEYEEDFANARARVLDWLGLNRTGEGIEFHAGKVYRHYYTNAQKQAIYEFLQEMSSSETWEMIKDYDFEYDTSTQ